MTRMLIHVSCMLEIWWSQRPKLTWTNSLQKTFQIPSSGRVSLTSKQYSISVLVHGFSSFFTLLYFSIGLRSFTFVTIIQQIGLCKNITAIHLWDVSWNWLGPERKLLVRTRTACATYVLLPTDFNVFHFLCFLQYLILLHRCKSAKRVWNVWILLVNATMIVVVVEGEEEGELLQVFLKSSWKWELLWAWWSNNDCFT